MCVNNVNGFVKFFLLNCSFECLEMLKDGGLWSIYNFVFLKGNFFYYVIKGLINC